YPLGARSVLTKWLDDKGRPAYILKNCGTLVFTGQKPLWFQAAGNTLGPSWPGGFPDADGNGVMEFADAAAPQPPRSRARGRYVRGVGGPSLASWAGNRTRAN